MRVLMITGAVLAIAVTSAAAQTAQTFSFTGLSQEDVLVIGAALDELPRKVTDRNRLYQRLQEQITAIAQSAAKEKIDGDKAAIDKAVAEALAKAKIEAAGPENKE